MDDTCAVCADTLEWVAYGPCLHKEVCSTCIIRLRFICNDFCCCICKSESNTIFVTKALGDYTRMISDFKGLGEVNGSEGKAGEYWYHEGTKAYFDDSDHYKMIKAMCKLSCNVCNKKNGGSKEFNSVEQLKAHLFHRHSLFMCSLCLEGRKIFISEQKLYNRAQLTQHVRTGDSVVDGNESERGGFTGHPMCEFCENPFYGDNELYLHMSTDHFTCHICQRQHPGQYEYFNNYDNLEIHFRQEHYLCEDEACLARKFIVFATEFELKRHNAMEHGGRMSRSKRSALLQIPVSFQFRQINEHDRRGGGRGSHSNSSGYQMNMAIEDSFETANAERSCNISLNAQTVSAHREEHEIDMIVNPFESLATTDSEPPSRYHHVLGWNTSRAPMEETSFPPLPLAPRSSQRRSRNGSGGLSGNTMAAHLSRQNMVKVLSSSRALPAANNLPNSLASISYQSRPVSDSRVFSSSRSLSSSVLSTYTSSPQAGSSRANELLVSSNSASSSRTSNSNSKVSQASDASNPADRTSHKSLSSVPPLSATQADNMSTSASPMLKVKDVQSANKALVEKIHAALEFDKDKFAAFKIISREYHRDIIDVAEYLAYVHQFGLSHLVLELARLCPKAEKQRELTEIYNFNVGGNGLGIDNGPSKSKKCSKKGKEKCDDNVISGSENVFSDSLRVEILPKDGDCGGKGKSKILVDKQANLDLSREPKSEHAAQAAGVSLKKNVGAGGGGKNKPRKKTMKFLKNRLGGTSTASLPDASNSDAGIDEKEEKADVNKDIAVVLPVHGVWKNGGGRKLLVMTQNNRK
ncbi:PREDICTED: E3 ubiquitin-protein ligase HEL2-like isoform X3 [Populus euphratica]|uniref:E3 ubiquitin-protein ligase HEL2-like isoform X3 n=1 Tax=Populus euphratica TaxID=75702 RepID=A0AAJ6U5V4_POPEU|nr:PREDICTED: E3 ubiquitin-protein ligase HEL2-like isoform X3 [Populus euphratica]